MDLIKYTPAGDDDLSRIKDAMEAIKEKSFMIIDDSVFDDKSLCENFNNMLDDIIVRNNKYLMRLNDAQIRIADHTVVRSLIDQVNFQKGPFDSITDASEHLKLNFKQNEEKQIEIIALSKQIESLMKHVINQSETDMDKSDMPQNVADIIDRVTKCFLEVTEQIKSLKQLAIELYNYDYDRRDYFEVFDTGIDSLISNYENLKASCLENGSRIYRISRDIDNARNDMFRHYSNATLIDRMKVFSVDHFTLAWRLYDIIAEYDQLKISQLNNPDSCKFGIWSQNVADPVIKESSELKEAIEIHNELHNHAVACYVANEASEKDTAAEEFEKTLKCSKDFTAALYRICDLMRARGYTDETEVWVFKR